MDGEGRADDDESPPMILAILAAATIAGEIAPAPGLVAPCIWTRMPAYKTQVLAAPDFKMFNTLRRGYPEAEAAAAFAACVPEETNDAAAEVAYTYYEASLWLRKRLVGKWPENALNGIDAIPETDLKYFWLQPDAARTEPGYVEARKAAWARAYKPFGREAPAATPDDLDGYIVARVGWRLGEIDYRGDRKSVV